MIDLNAILKVLKDEGLILKDEKSLTLNETFSNQGIDSMMRADIYITLGEFYKVDLMDVAERKLTTFQSIINYIDNVKKK